MKLRRVVRRTVPIRGEGVDGTVHVNAAFVANVGEAGTTRTRVSSRQRVVQRSGRTRGTETREVPGNE